MLKLKRGFINHNPRVYAETFSYQRLYILTRQNIKPSAAEAAASAAALDTNGFLTGQS
jgi:hypothetical protein